MTTKESIQEIKDFYFIGEHVKVKRIGDDNFKLSELEYVLESLLFTGNAEECAEYLNKYFD